MMVSCLVGGWQPFDAGESAKFRKVRIRTDKSWKRRRRLFHQPSRCGDGIAGAPAGGPGNPAISIAAHARFRLMWDGIVQKTNECYCGFRSKN
jgi:hypothetical protein